MSEFRELQTYTEAPNIYNYTLKGGIRMNIKNATAQYTGGGIYIYYGQLENGYYFRAGDEEDFIEICDTDTSTDEADYNEFYEKHRVETLTSYPYITLWNKMLVWIIENEPRGNYSISELQRRLIELNPGIKRAIEHLESWDQKVTKENLIKVFETWIANLQSHIGPEAHLHSLECGVEDCSGMSWGEQDEIYLREIETYKECLAELNKEGENA